MRFAAVIIKGGDDPPTEEEAQRVLVGMLKRNEAQEWAAALLNQIARTRTVPELYGWGCPVGLQRDMSLAIAKQLAQDIPASGGWRLYDYSADGTDYHCCIGMPTATKGTDGVIAIGSHVAGQDILLDGAKLINSTFQNCTFFYRGGDFPLI